MDIKYPRGNLNFEEEFKPKNPDVELAKFTSIDKDGNEYLDSKEYLNYYK